MGECPQIPWHHFYCCAQLGQVHVSVGLRIDDLGKDALSSTCAAVGARVWTSVGAKVIWLGPLSRVLGVLFSLGVAVANPKMRRLYRTLTTFLYVIVYVAIVATDLAVGSKPLPRRLYFFRPRFLGSAVDGGHQGGLTDAAECNFF